MDWKELGAKIANYAPALGATLGSVIPGAGTAVGGAVGLAVQALAGLLGITSQNPTPAELGAAIGVVTPELALKLKVADQTFSLAMRNIEKEELQARLIDVQSARDKEKAVVASTGEKDTNLYVLAWVLVVGFFCLTATLMYIPLPLDQSGVIFMLFGSLSTGFGNVISYFFGSSKGSAEKSKTMEAIARNGK